MSSYDDELVLGSPRSAFVGRGGGPATDRSTTSSNKNRNTNRVSEGKDFAASAPLPNTKRSYEYGSSEKGDEAPPITLSHREPNMSTTTSGGVPSGKRGGSVGDARRRGDSYTTSNSSSSSREKRRPPALSFSSTYSGRSGSKESTSYGSGDFESRGRFISMNTISTLGTDDALVANQLIDRDITEIDRRLGNCESSIGHILEKTATLSTVSKLTVDDLE